MLVFLNNSLIFEYDLSFDKQEKNKQDKKTKNKKQKEKEEIRKSNFNLNGYDPTIYKRKKT